MISSNFKEYFEHVLDCPITKVESVSGGDISNAYCLHTATEPYFLKTNASSFALEMFKSEQTALISINKINTIKAPEVLGTGRFQNSSYIIMEFIRPKQPSQKDMENLGHQLAAMHQASVGQSFGWKQNNFIGTLTQSNKMNTNWIEFYVHERLLPQLKMSKDNGFLNSNEILSAEKLIKNCEEFFPVVKPSLLHGDLWSGNYLIRHDGVPYLIDPAVYIGHHEVDLAMTSLFGGFSPDFYSAYAEHTPKESFQQERNDIYQLYYLLVHLNLFGKSYYPVVQQLLKTYFN